MLRRSLAKVSSGLRKVVSEGEWTRLFGAAPGRNHGSFQEYCQDIQLVKELMAENDQAISSDSAVVLNGLLSDILGYLTSESSSSTGHPGPCLEKLVEETLLELLVRWSSRLASVEELWRVQLRFYLVLLSESSQPVLQHMSIVRPLKRALQETAQAVHTDRAIAEAFVQLLMQLSVIVSREKCALEQFLAVGRDSLMGTGAKSHSQCAEFAIFSYLVPYMHHSGVVGNQARDALLLCLLQAASNDRALSYIKNDSNFCLMLAHGLGGLYSELPTVLKFSCSDWSDLTHMPSAVPGLETFVQSLRFCSEVIEVSLPGISSQLASLIRTGFLEQILAEWLLQAVSKNTIAAVAYLTVIVKSISEPVLLQEVVKFILHHVDVDGNRLIHRLVAYINSRDAQLTNVTLALFLSLLELNCEDVMLELALRYLLPGDHIQPSQWPLISQPDLSSESATRFLVLIPSCCWHGEQLYSEHAQRLAAEAPAVSSGGGGVGGHSILSSVLQSGEKPAVQTQSPSQPSSASCNATVVSSYRELLSDARIAVQSCSRACRCWSSRYSACEQSFRSQDIVPFNGWSSLATPVLSTPSATPSRPRGSSKLQDDGAASSSGQSSDSAIGRSPRLEGRMRRQRSDSTDSCSSRSSFSFPTSGLFLAALLDRLGSLLTHDSYTTLLVTALLSRLATYPQPLLTSYLLNHSLTLKADVPSLHRTLNNLKDLIDSMSKRYDGFPHYLARARKTLLVRQLPAAVSTSVQSNMPDGMSPSQPCQAMPSRTRPLLQTAQSSDLGGNPNHQAARVTSSLPPSAAERSTMAAKAGAAPGKKKRPAAQMLFSIVMLHEFLKEMAAIAQEQTLVHFDMIQGF